MRKPSTSALRRRGKLQDGQLTIGLDLGDRSSFYCVLNGAGEVILEEKVTTSPEAGAPPSASNLFDFRKTTALWAKISPTTKCSTSSVPGRTRTCSHFAML